MADINKYEILISTKETSDPKKAESIKKSLDSPSVAFTNQDEIRREIASFATPEGPQLNTKDIAFLNSALNKLASIIKSIITVGVGVGGTCGKSPVRGFGDVSEEEAVPSRPRRKRKKVITPPPSVSPWQEEEQPPIEQPKPVTKRKGKQKKWDWVAPSERKAEVVEAERAKKEKAEQPKIPARRTTGKEISLVESSDALMSQIKNDFAKFKKSLADTIRTRLQTEHAGGFKVVEEKGGAYTRRGGTEVLKIANVRELTSALLKLTNSVEKTAALEKEGPAAMIEHASDVVAKEMIGKLGKKEKTQSAEAVRRTVAYINKHGYEGSNEAIKKLVKGRAEKERGIPLEERKGISVRQFNKVMAADATARGVEPNIRSVFGETVAKEEINRTIGKAVKEVVIPRPVAGPQGLPAIKIPSGGHRALAPEYEFTPGILAAGEFAGKLIKAGGKALPEKAVTERLQRVTTDKDIDARGRVITKVPNIKQMMVAGDVGGMAAHASDIMEVLKTDKKGRLELISAYRTVLGKKGEKIATETIPKGKKEQLKYLEDLSGKAKRCSLGFDDVIVAMGKLTKSNIYERLLGSLTAEGVGGKTSPVRTTMRDIGRTEDAITQFNKRIREPFTQQEIISEHKPRLSYYQSKVSKMISPRLTAGGPEDFVGGVETKASLTALNKQTEQFLALKGGVAGYPEKLTSQGVAESRSVKVAPDPRDASKIITNAFTEDIRKTMPLGEWSNFGRSIASVYQATGGGKAAGGVVTGGLEMSRLQSQRGRAVEKSGMWGKGYGLNLQTVIADSAGTFEDQIEIAGKAVNRFSEYIKPKIKDVKDVGSADVVAQDIVKSFAPAIGAQLRMKEPGKATGDKLLVSEISKVLTSKTGASLGQQSVSIVERIFTALGTKMTTHAGSKGTVTFKKGEEGELGYTKRPTPTHELMSGLLKEKKGVSKKQDKQVDKMLGDLKEVGTAPFIEFMHRDLSKEVQQRFKKIKNAVLKMLDIDPSLTNEDLVNRVNSMAKKTFGDDVMTKRIPNEVRMSLTGAVKRLNLAEPLETVFNNIAGGVEAIAPTTADLSPKGEVSKVLQAMGYGWGPETGKEKRTLPMYSEMEGMGGLKQAIAGPKFWQYTREPSQEEEWAKKDIWSGRKGQKMNIAAMGAITSMFGEKSLVTQEAISASMPETNRALETIMSLRTLGEEPVKDVPKSAYVSTKGLKELPGVIEKYEDLRDTILDPKFSAGGYADIPEFGEKGKEIGARPLYVPSREAIATYEEPGVGLGANTLATRFGSLLANVEKYKQIKGQTYLKTDKPDIDVLRRNVGTEIGKTISSFRKNINAVFKDTGTKALGKEDTSELIKFLNKLYRVLDKMSDAEIAERAPGIDKGRIKATIAGVREEVKGGVLPKFGGGLGKAQKLLMHLKDVVIEPKIDTKNIERATKDLGLMEKGGSFADLSEESYFRYKKEAVSRTKSYEAKKAAGEKVAYPGFGEKGFEEESLPARQRIVAGLNTYIKRLSASKGGIGALSASEAAVMEGAKQFGITTDPKKQALEESRRNIERDKRRLGEELVGTTVGKKKGIDILQTRKIPAIRGQLHAAVSDKVDDFEAAIRLINEVGGAGMLKDTGITQSIKTQIKTHKKAVDEEIAAGGVVLKEGEVGLPAARIEKISGEYGKGKTTLDAIREGQKITAMTTRFPYTGVSSTQFARIRELEHPAGRHVISVPGAAPGTDPEELEGIIGTLKTQRGILRKRRTDISDEKPGTAAAKEADAKRQKLTININKLSEAIDLVTVKFHGFAQGADIDGDHINVHAAKTKAAQKEMENVAKDYRKGTYGKTLDPRAAINQMMSYNVAGEKSSLAKLADMYTQKSGIPGAKVFQMPDITKELKSMTSEKVFEGLAGAGVTREHIAGVVKKKGLKGPEATETTARSMLYDKLREKQYGKIYVKAGLGESTESINRLARFLEASVGFGEGKIRRKEYGGWREESVALGAVYGKGGKVKQLAKPGREMQTMMNQMLHEVIQSGMGAKHGGKAMFEEVSKGLASGTLFGKIGKDERFKGILEANEIIKSTIRDRLEALNAVDFAAEARRHKFGKGIKGRKAITNELVKKFSFEGFVGDMSEDIQNQALGVMTKRGMRRGLAEPEARESAIRERRKKLETGSFDISSYFPEMQPTYAIRSSRSSVESLSKQTKKGKTTLDKAMHRILSVVRASGEGVTLSDTLVQSSFRQLFEMFGTADRLGQNLEKVFTKGKTLKRREKDTAALGRKLGVPKASAKETEMLMAEARKKHIEEFPAAKEDTTQLAERRAVLRARQTAIKKHVAVTRHKRDLLSRVSPELGAMYQGYAEEAARRKGVPLIPPTKKPPMPPQGERAMFGGAPAMGVVREEWAMDEERVAAALQEKKIKEQERRKIGARKRGRLSKGEYVYPQPFDIEAEGFKEPYSFRKDVSYALKSREIKSRALIHAQTLKQTEFKSQIMPSGEILLPTGPPGEQVPRGRRAVPGIPKIPRGKTADIDYSMFGKGDVRNFVSVLEKYREALKLLSEGTKNLTEKQTKRAAEALQFIEKHRKDLASIPVGARGYKAAADVLGLSDKIKGVRKKTPAAIIPPETVQYGSDLEALTAMVAKAEKAAKFSAEGMPDEAVDILKGIRTKRIASGEGAKGLRSLMDVDAIPKARRRSVWKQYHVEKVQAEVLEAQRAEKEGDPATKARAVLAAKERIVQTFPSSLTPFLTRAGGTGRVTGHIDEAARTKLGIRRVGVEKKEIYDTMATESGTAAAAMKPLLFGTGRMEGRLKEAWAILRRFSPELAKAGKFSKAFNFENAIEDIAIIREGLQKLKFAGRQMSPGEAVELEHALGVTKKMEKAVVGKDIRALPTMALPELETRETAEAAFENLQTKAIEDMMADVGVSVAPGVKRKVSMKIPTGRGTVEKREVTLVAEGAEAFGAAGKVTGIKKVAAKTTVEKEYMPSTRAVKLFEQFGKSTDSMSKRIKDMYLGVKRFSSETGKVNFDEALSDLQDLQILIAATLKMPGLTEKQGIELGHLKKKVALAHKVIAETPPEAMPGVIMKDMETQKSAEAALKQQIALKKELMMKSEDLEVGMAATVAATIPTEKGPEKRKVKLVAAGEEGVVTGIKEEKYKPRKEFVDELLKGKTSRASSLFKSFIEGTGDTNKRISKMVLGMKRFDMSLVKAGKHAQAMNFDTAEADLVEMIALFDRLLKGATTLTDKEREMYTMARTVAKEMKGKVVKVPAGARAGITMGGYETPESSLAAYRADIKAKKRELIEKGELGRKATVVGKIMTASGQEETRKTKLTARGDRWFGFGGRTSRVSERDESPQGQTGSVLRRVAMWGSASGIIYGIIGGVRSMLETMKVAETGMVNLQKVMPRVGTDFDKMRESAIGFAKTYGAELKGVLETMRIFAQQGLPQPQVLELTRVSTLAANVTTMDPTKAAEALTSATRQFNIEGEDAIKILDSWNEVENKFAITAADLADGFKKAGTAARITGIDVHKLNGIITAIGEATRQTGKEVGTSLKFIFSRMATEKAPRALTAVGVETMEGGRLREGSDILDDLAVKWVGLTRSQKLATAQAIGGIRHYNALMVLMANYHRALSATEASINSVGSAEKENKMVMETYAKQLAKTKASFDALAVSASGPILSALKIFTKTIRGIIDVLTMIPGGGLGAMMMGAYGAATGLGKYFDLSMFGLLGERGVGGEQRKRRTPFGAGRAIREKFAPIGERALQAGAVSSMMFGVEKTEQRGLMKQVAPAKVAPSVGALGKLKNAAAGIGPAFITARNTSLGFLASLGPFAKIAITLAAIGAAVWGMGKAMGSTFAVASERTEEYTKSLEVVEGTLDKIGSARTLASRVAITTKRVETLSELTPRQVAAQVQGRSYKSPLLLMKTQQQQVQDYANAVASMTTEGTYGFDRFGNAIISTTEELGNVITALEEIAVKSMVDLKLNIIEEQLKDLMSGPEIDGMWDRFLKNARDLIRGTGKLVGADLMEGYLNTYEKTSENVDETMKMRREAAKEGRTITPPSVELKKKDPELYKKRKEEHKKYTELNVERMSLLKEFDEKFIESKRQFMTIRRPGLSPELAEKAAMSEAGAQMAAIEEARSPFYRRRGVEQEEIQAGYFHKLIGSMAIRPTAMLTRETAMEQGIAPREATAAVLEAIRPGDIMLAREGAKFRDKEGEFGISGGQIQVLKSVGAAGEDMVAYVRKSAEGVIDPIVQTKKEFFDMLGGVQKVAENIREVVDSAGMLSETAMKLRAISIVPTGAEAGMFRPTKAKKLDLGKQYKFQIDTGMLIQNNAFRNLSKNTEGFVNSYVKKQEELRKSQKIALDVYGKRGVIDDADAAAAKALALNLAGVTNTAIQLIRATTEMDKAFARLALRAKEQAAIKEVGREVRLKRTGLLAGMPEVKVPQIDIRKFSELSGHEKLRATSPEYEKNLLAYDTQLDKYNAAVAKAETSAKTLADIEYVEEEAAGRGIDQKEIDSLIAGVAITGSKETGPMLSEMSTQTTLQHEMVDKLTSLVGFSSKGMGAGIEFATMTRESEDKYEKAALRQQTVRTVASDVAGLMAKGDLGAVYDYSKNLEKASTSAPFTKQNMVNAILGSSAAGSGALETILTSKKIGVSPEDYKKAKEEGKIDTLLSENYKKFMEYLSQYGKETGKGKGEETTKETGTALDFMGGMKEIAGEVIKEQKARAEKAHEANLEDAKVQGNIATVFAQSLSKAQKAMRMFTIVAGDLAKSVESLSESFLKLEKQSMINKALIETRAKYRSTRGGPMERRAPAVDVDIATTAQYSPHQLLYEQSAQYKSATTGYLKNMEDVKAARSKLEELSKIEAQKEFLGKQPGVKKEDVDSFVSAAMRTGSVEIAPIVVELAKLNDTAKSIDAKTVELKDGKPVTGEQQKSDENLLSAMQQQAKADNRRAEILAKRSADYMRKQQIRKQTDIEIATGSGKSQDQINREESGWIASVGYVPSEIKERNQRLRAEYEKEKRARAEFELNKQRMLKPLQQAAGGMGSIISSIQTGVAGIEGGRNVRPLEEDFTRWSRGRSEEDVAEARGQFDLAKSIYSQNLSLRAQGADTGIAPRALYDIMERASKGEDVTEELKAIESVLAEKKEEKEEQIRKIQAQEYAKAMSSSEGTKKTNTELSAINENTKTMAGVLNEGFSKVTSAVESSIKTEGVAQSAALGREESQKVLQVAKDIGPTLGYEIPLRGMDVSQAAAAMPFEEKVKPSLPGVFGQGEYLLGSDERKSQMAASLPIFGKGFVETDFGYDERLKEAGKTEEEIKKEEMIKSVAKGGLTMALPEEGETVKDFAERTKSPEKKREDAIREDIKSKYRSDRPVDSYEILKEEVDSLGAKKETLGVESKRDRLFDKEDVSVEEKEKAAGIKEESKEAKDLKEKALKETEQAKVSKKENKELNTEISDLKEEVEKLKTTITDVNTVFKDLSDSAGNVIALGDASKDSASFVDSFGKSVSAVSISLDVLSSKASTATITTEETGPTMVAEGADFNFISEEDAINLVNFTKGELLENINNINNTELLDNLVEKTEVISKDVASIKENVTLISDVVSEEDFNTFKEKAFKYFEEVDKIKDLELDELASSTVFDDLKSIVFDYVETVDKLRTLVDGLVDTSSSHFTSILELETAFNLVSDELRDHGEKFIKLEDGLGTVDHKFTTLVDDLKDDVGEAMNLAWAAQSLASQK